MIPRLSRLMFWSLLAIALAAAGAWGWALFWWAVMP